MCVCVSVYPCQQANLKIINPYRCLLNLSVHNLIQPENGKNWASKNWAHKKVPEFFFCVPGFLENIVSL